MSRNLAPDTTNLFSHQARIGNTIQQVRGAMPLHSGFDFSHEGVADAREVRILPRASGGFGGAITVPFRLFDIADADFTESSNYAHTELSEWRLDLNDSTIDLVNRKSGLIDGITFDADQYGRDWLVWALLDKFLNFVGFGLTRKPYTTFSAIGGDGTAAKGEAGVVFTVPGFAAASQFTGYNFTIGARVVVRNAVGTAPQYEWNWATVTAVSNTTITLTMDNHAAYGVNITGVTTGEILQWDMFRPYVVSASGQTLYGTDYYFQLLGELYTNASGDIVHAYRADEPWRQIPLSLVTSGTGAITKTTYSQGRYVPLWASQGVFRLNISGTTVNQYLALYEDVSVNMAMVVIINVSGAGIENYGAVSLRRFASVDIEATNTGTNLTLLTGYYCPGGMRA